MAYADNLRRHFPAVRQTAYLNTATYGALPDVTVSAMKETLDWQLTEGRSRDKYQSELTRVQSAVREHLAMLFHVSSLNFALTDGTTHALNIVLSGLPFRAGDEVIVTDIEHHGALLPVFQQKQKRGIVLKVAHGSTSGEELCMAVKKMITPRTRLLVVSHVSYLTGQRLPIEQLTQIAHEHQVLILIDGAQGAGAEEINLKELGCDFYAFSGQKWLCGPEGTGALYVDSRHFSLLDSTYVGSPTLLYPDAYALNGTYLSVLEARRYEHTRSNLVTWRGFLESLKMRKITIGEEYAYIRIHGLSGYLFDQLLDFANIKLWTPREARVGIVVFQIESTDVLQVAKELQQRSIDIRAIPRFKSIRVSPSFYNNEEDIDRLLRALKSIESFR